MKWKKGFLVVSLLLTLVLSACASESEKMGASVGTDALGSAENSNQDIPLLGEEASEERKESSGVSEAESAGGNDQAAESSSAGKSEAGSSQASGEEGTSVNETDASQETTASSEQEKQESQNPDGVRMVSNVPHVVNPGATFTGRAPLEAIEYAVTDPENSRMLSTEKYSHSYGVAKDGAPHNITVTNQALFDSYGTGALAWDNITSDKVLYLTFDCGYEYENLTSDILDTLAEKQVTAAFFCTLDYLEEAPEIAARMINEGHTVGNHSTTHPSDSSLLTREELAWEVLGVHNYLRVNFGYESSYFRFPTGTCSENALDLMNSIGYKSIFWSIAHADWDPANQPGVEKSYQTVTSRLHPGAVILLHATSPDNAAILGDFIDYAHSQGYSFRALVDYPWNG